MGYNQQDAYNLNRSQVMFDSIEMDTEEHGEKLMLFPITRTAYGEDAAIVLRNALISATNFDQSVNVWIDVRCTDIPAFVRTAINGCQGFGLRLVLTHGTRCSHPPGEPLEDGLLQAIARASGSRTVWHPILKARVAPIPRNRKPA